MAVPVAGRAVVFVRVCASLVCGCVCLFEVSAVVRFQQKTDLLQEAAVIFSRTDFQSFTSMTDNIQFSYI